MKIFNILIICSLLLSLPILSSTPKINISFQENDMFEYIIICPLEFKNNFYTLATYKSHFISSTIITIEEIIANKDFWVDGRYGDSTNRSNGNPWIHNGEEIHQNMALFNDTQSKIRNFLRFAHDQWNTTYVLLGGDNEHIPSRRLYCRIQNWTNTVKIKSIESFIISDHYFSALNGTWNADEDTRFGEEELDSIKDEADFTQELYVGRAPVNDKNDVNVFVQKVISFETTEKPNIIQFQQSYIQPSRIPDTVPVSENAAQWIPETYTIHRLYERDETITADQWVDVFNKDETFILYQIGNGYNDELFSWYQLSWEESRRNIFSVLDVGQLHNSFFPIHFSISCQTADFSEDECLAEELLLTQNGGVSACIGNTEVGCLNITNAEKYSSEFFEKMFYELFENKTEHLGKMFQKSKEYFIKHVTSAQQYRWCFYELILLGDPETPAFSTRIKPMQSTSICYVDDDYTPDHTGWNRTHFSSIQQAHNHCEEFGIIYINPGIYKEHVVVNKTLTIQGNEKNDTVLTNIDTRPIITLECHTSSIHNLTICNTLNSKNDCPNSLIYIKHGYNGNKIKNCIIKGNAQYSILIKDSIRNQILHNIIQDTQSGIGIINTMEGLLPTRVIVTCDNIISRNIIQRNQHCGIYIECSLHNYIINNIFLQNGLNTTNPLFNNNESNLCLMKTKLNTIDGNYWEKPQDSPYLIWANHGPVTIFSVDISKGLLFKYYKCILILNIGYPYPVFDYHPSTEI